MWSNVARVTGPEETAFAAIVGTTSAPAGTRTSRNPPTSARVPRRRRRISSP